MQEGRFYRHPKSLEVDIYVWSVRPEEMYKRVGVVWFLQRNHGAPLGRGQVEWYNDYELEGFELLAE